MKTYYELLGVPSNAPADDIKSAFRREIARYHPDKVHHLGQEFQEIASTRAAELTEAYRILMDPAARAAYDTSLVSGSADNPAPAAPPSPDSRASVVETRDPTQAKQAPQPHVSESLRETRASVSVFVRKAAISRIRDVVEALSGSVETPPDGAFDTVFVLRPKRSLFQKADPPVRVAVKVVERVDVAAIDAIWPAAQRGPADAMPCVLLCGTGLAAPRELAGAIAEQRRRNRQAVAPIVVPVDTRDWDALIPPDTPAPVRKLLERLKLGV